MLLGLWLLDSRWVAVSYDWTTRLIPAEKPGPDFPVAIVYLDLESYRREHQSPGIPWDRSLHARLVRRLKFAGAKSIVFDVVFAGPGPNADADAAFVEEIRDSRRVVLASELAQSLRSTDGTAPDTRSWDADPPWKPLADAAAGWGIATLAVDGDFVARRHSPGLPSMGRPSLAWAVARDLDLPSVRGAGASTESRWLRYIGGPLAIPSVGYTAALDGWMVPDAFFRDRVVFVGSLPMAGLFGERGDAFRNPRTASDGRDSLMPAVEIHATQMANLIRGDWLRRGSAATESWIVAACGLLLPALLLRLRPLPAAGVAAGLGLAMIAAAGVGGARLGIWFPWTIVVCLQLPASFGAAALYQTLEWYRTKRRLEAEALRAQRMETIGTIAGGMAHDLNNVLSPILMGAQLLRRKTRDDDADRLLAMMETNARRGGDLVRQVLLFARGHGDAAVLVDAGTLVREMEHVVRRTFPRNIRVAAMAPPDLWPVLGNATQLHQVLLNLCVNARDAMPGGGDLTLAADNVGLGEAEASAIPGGRPGDHVMLLVADSGTGIAPETLPHIFEPFFTTKPEGSGTGLGLPTVERIIRAHGGFLHVRSEPAQGTTFEVYLPRAAAPWVQEDGEAPPSGRGERILLVDAEESVRSLVAPTLSAHGYRVAIASSAAEGIAIVESDRGFALALFDAGAEAAERGRFLAALAATGVECVEMCGPGSESEDARRGLRKPFRPGELLRVVALRIAAAANGEGQKTGGEPR